MPSLISKLVLTPLLVSMATLAGRRWGPSRSGWLVALPLTSGPIVLFISLDQGAAAGSMVAVGALAGSIAVCAFCVMYARSCGRWSWPVALALSSCAFGVVSWAIPQLD